MKKMILMMAMVLAMAMGTMANVAGASDANDQCNDQLSKERAERSKNWTAEQAMVKGWAEKAAQGDPKSQLFMAYHNEHTDVFVARMYYKMAADQGFKDAIKDLKRFDERQKEAKK